MGRDNQTTLHPSLQYPSPIWNLSFIDSHLWVGGGVGRGCLMREGPDIRFIFGEGRLYCDIKLLSAVSYGFIPVAVLILFVRSQPSLPLKLADELQNPQVLTWNEWSHGLHACDQNLDGENGRSSLESSGTSENIFLPLLLLGRKIHFSRIEGKERCERETDFYGFLNERNATRVRPLFLLTLFSRYPSSPVAIRVIKLTLYYNSRRGSGPRIRSQIVGVPN